MGDYFKNKKKVGRKSPLFYFISEININILYNMKNNLKYGKNK